MGEDYHDLITLNHTTNEDRVLMLTPTSTAADFFISVFDAAAAMAPDTSSADSDDSDVEVDIVKYSITTAPETKLFAVAKTSNDGDDVDYFLSSFPLAPEVEPNDSEATAQSLNVTTSSYQAIEGAADATDLSSEVELNGTTLDIEDVFTFTMPRTAIYSIALRIDDTATGDLNVFTVTDIAGTEIILGSQVSQTSSPGINVEAITGYALGGETVTVYVDAASGASAYILGVQVISVVAESTPSIYLNRLTDPSADVLFDLNASCSAISVIDNNCEFSEDDIYSISIEISGILNDAFNVNAFSLGFPHNGVKFPLNSDNMIEPGAYDINLSGVYFDLISVPDDHTLTSEASVIVKRDQDPNFGRLNLNIYFVGSTVIDSATSSGGSDRIDQLLISLDETYGQIGVELGTVNRLEVSGASADALSVDFNVNDQTSIDSLLATIEREDSFLNVFVIDSFSLTGLLGFSVGIPGLPIVEGYPASGVVFGMLEPFEDQSGALFKLFRDTFAHEVGHYLGLFHTSEAGGDVFDPLDDTDQCPLADNDSNSDGVVSFSECSSAGATNLMFWSAPDTALGANAVTNLLTEQQGYVMNVNSYVR
jgi:hypothetical protein